MRQICTKATRARCWAGWAERVVGRCSRPMKPPPDPAGVLRARGYGVVVLWEGRLLWFPMHSSIRSSVRRPTLGGVIPTASSPSRLHA